VNNETIIVAPHADDEIIGCFEIITNEKIKPIIIYTEEMEDERKQATLKLKELTPVKIQLYLRNIPPAALNHTNKFFFPHPIYETHPAHRAQGFVGEQLARGGLDVTFYITEMTAPFKFECAKPFDKHLLLEDTYPDQSKLWKYDHKYFLFSGYDKWIFNPLGGFNEKPSIIGGTK